MNTCNPMSDTFINREEKWVLFKTLFDLTEKNKYDDFFSRNEPLNEEEKLEYSLYWEQLLAYKIRKKKMLQIRDEENRIKDQENRIKDQENRIKEQENRIKGQENRIKDLELMKKKRKLDEETEQEAADLQKCKLELENLLDNRYNFKSHSKQMQDLLETLKNHNYSLIDRENQRKLSLSKIYELSLHVKKIFNQNEQDFVLQQLGLKVVLNDSGKAFAPCRFTGFNDLDLQAVKQEYYIIFGHPIDDNIEFPVVFCHQMFGDFLDIINDNRDNKIVEEYFSFLDEESGNNLKKLNICYVQLFNAILSHSGTEVTISKEVTEAFSKLFGAEHIKQNADVRKFSTDAIISLKDFPFAIIEFKDRKYSIEAVYRALQYYASYAGSYIDNFPSFIITIDRCFMSFFGVATVNYRSVCDHLVTIELTGCRSETNDSMTKFRRIIGALSFFHLKIRNRLKNISNENEFREFSDELNENYEQLNSSMNQCQTLFPAVFDIKNCENSSRIPIKFVEKILNNVYIVTCEDRKYILKLSKSYGLDAHLHLASLNLAPKIVGYEKKYGNYHLILMEYMDPTEWKMLLNYQSDVSNNILSTNIIFDSLKKALDDFHLSGFVHGDFRNSNILMKVSDANNYEFKFIDFDISGKVDSRYPNLIFKNPEINWPTNNFQSDSKRKIGHDLYMFNAMKSEMSTNHNNDH